MVGTAEATSPRASDDPPSGSQAEGAVYRPHERTSRLRFSTPPLGVSVAGTLVLGLLCAILAFGYPSSAPALPGLSSVAGGPFISGLLVFLVPGLIGGLATPPLAIALGGKLRAKRSFLLVLVGLGMLVPILLLWRGLSALLGAYSVEGPLLLGFGLTTWIRQLTLVGISHRVHARSLPAALVVPLLGYAMVWAELGWSLRSVVEGVAFLALAFAGAAVLVLATDRPMVREFGQGGTSLLRPLMEHMSDRDPAASDQMERFFEGVSTKGDLQLEALTFREGSKLRLAWVSPSIHPGPFAELGSSDLPQKVGKALRQLGAEGVMVPHSPSTHAQDIPTTAEVDRVMSTIRELVVGASPQPEVASPLVSPHADSLVRAQVLGNCVLLLLTQAPAPTDDIDYALGEALRDEAKRQGFAHAVVVDAHNSFVENKGEVPFGSPEGFRLLADARAAMTAARARAVAGPLRLGFAQRRGFNPEDHGMGGEGLSVAVLETGKERTTFALFDANNLQQGLRDPLVRVLERAVGGQGEVMTTDNHVVHEVQGGTNPLGLRRGLDDLSRDLEEVAKEALSTLRPVSLGGAEVKVPSVKVLGPGVTTRLMTALADSFAIFWLFFLASISIAALAGALILALWRG